MPTFLDDLSVVDQTAIEQTGPQYIKGQWWNGEQKLRASGGIAYLGGLLIDRDKYLPDFVKAAPGWTDAPHTFDNGKTINAVTSAAPLLAVVRTRFRWFVTRNGETTYFHRNAFDASKGMRGQLQALCAVRGYDFPVAFTFKGMASKHFGQAVRDFTTRVNETVARVTAESNSPVGGKYPRFAFWMPVKPGAHVKVGQKGEESTITPPTLDLPNLLDGGWLESAYVGRTNLQAFQAHWHEAAEWAAAWDKGQPSQPAEPDDFDEAYAAAEAERTAPVADTEMTFGAGNPKRRPSQYDANL